MRYAGFDLTALTPGQRDVLIPALQACRFPTGRIRNRTGTSVPIRVGDLSRWARALEASGHGHVHRTVDGEEQHGHLLGEPATPDARQATLGLYWLPTPKYPAGQVEIEQSAMSDPALAREVLLAESAHAVDYGAMTDSQRQRIEALFDFKGTGNPPVGWFEELGEQTYWRWRGERWMGLFMAAFAPDLPRPLERRQPWQWSYDASDVARARAILRRPSS